jgi:uncharacterized protein (DUF1499 family)
MLVGFMKIFRPILFKIAIALAVAVLLFAFPATSLAAGSLGLDNGLLKACPTASNCVASQNADSAHAIDPIEYQTDLDTARSTLLKILTVVPRTKTIESTPSYIRAESTSRVFDFIDDLEFYFPSNERVIHLRSAARVGAFDLGMNRRRLEQIRLAMNELLRGK